MNHTQSRSSGFTLVEVLIAAAIMGFGLVIALPSLGGFTESARTTGMTASAHALVSAVNIYRTRTGNAISGTAVRPITHVRINQIYAQISGPINPDGEVIVESGYQISPSAVLPPNWGELQPGIFDPLP